MKLPKRISFDWDEDNIDKNWAKHTVYFKEAEEVFLNNSLRIFPDKKHSQKEKRLLALGVTNLRRKLTIVFTLRDNNIRIISARQQSKKEQKKYAKKENN